MSIRTLLEDNLKRNPGRRFFLFRCGKEVCSRTYGESGVRIAQMAEVTASLGVRPRSAPVAIILENGPVWIELYLAHASLAVPVVPVDPKLRPEEISYMMGDAGVQAIYTDARHISVIEEIAPGLEALTSVVLVDGKEHGAPTEIAGLKVYDLESKMEELAAAAASPTGAFASARVSDDDVASIIYTSGTTGRPKGALITHGNFCADIEGAVGLIPSASAKEEFFVVLPLFHAFSFCANFLGPLRLGAGMQFTTSLRTIGEDMRAFQPTLLMAVPLLVEKMYAKVQDGLQKSRAAKVLMACGLGAIVVHKIRKSFGGRLRILIVGGAPCSAELLKAMRRLKMPIIEGYGLTEASPIVSITRLEHVKPGSIGVPLPNIEVRIADKNENGIGELQVRGPIVMHGYLNKPEATAETIESDGWLHTGDLASQDEEGFIFIRGRKKSLIVNREGKNIYPEEVEICIGNEPKILDVIVQGYSDTADEVGEKVGAIVVPNLDTFKRPDGSLPDWKEIEEETRRLVLARCEHLAEYKHPRKIAVYKEPLERTSSQKIRRYVYKDALNGHSGR